MRNSARPHKPDVRAPSPCGRSIGSMPAAHWRDRPLILQVWRNSIDVAHSYPQYLVLEISGYPRDLRLFGNSAMLIFHAPKQRSPWFVLAFAASWRARSLRYADRRLHRRIQERSPNKVVQPDALESPNAGAIPYRDFMLLGSIVFQRRRAARKKKAGPLSPKSSRTWLSKPTNQRHPAFVNWCWWIGATSITASR